jgi:DNA invertase Pin-like site-specific DNA recombinase
MMEDVRKGEINLVLVQDLSRFGRNYLEAGKYLEEELPTLGCRFIALSDGIDTEDGENDIMPFLNMMNDYYLKNLSDKITVALKAKARDGQKLSGSVPYGFKRNPKERTRLIIDEPAAEVVKKIFALRAEGIGFATIAGILNKENIPSPRLNIWKATTIKRMLQNESYIGHTISFKRKPRSYRNGKGGTRDKSEWIRAENTHMPIIPQELWERCLRPPAAQKPPQPALFGGIVVCADCGSNMAYQLDKDKYGSYLCKTHKSSGRAVCSWHRISETALKKLVLSHIKEQAATIALGEDNILQELQQRLSTAHTSEKPNPTKERQDLEHQLHKLETEQEQLYEDKFSGIISTETYIALAEKTETQRLDIIHRLKSINQTSEQLQANLNNINHWFELIKEKSIFNEVDIDLLESLIDRIEVGEKQVIDGIKTQEVNITFRYACVYLM